MEFELKSIGELWGDVFRNPPPEEGLGPVGDWSWDPEFQCFENKAWGYHIEHARASDGVACASWLAHLRGKVWVDSQCLGDLFTLMDRVNNFQRQSGGV